MEAVPSSSWWVTRSILLIVTQISDSKIGNRIFFCVVACTLLVATIGGSSIAVVDCLLLKPMSNSRELQVLVAALKCTNKFVSVSYEAKKLNQQLCATEMYKEMLLNKAAINNVFGLKPALLVNKIIIMLRKAKIKPGAFSYIAFFT